MSEEAIMVYEFQKNAWECVRVYVDSYRGHRLINLRVFYSHDDGYKPSRKGLAINVKLLPELERAVQELRKAVDVSEED